MWGVARCCLPQSPGQPQHLKYQNRIWWWWFLLLLLLHVLLLHVILVDRIHLCKLEHTLTSMLWISASAYAAVKHLSAWRLVASLCQCVHCEGRHWNGTRFHGDKTDKMNVWSEEICIFAVQCYAQVLPVLSCGICLSVHPSRLCILSKQINMSSKLIQHRMATPF